MNSTDKKALERDANLVGEAHDAYESAVEDSESAAVDLLDDILRLASPALLALSSLVQEDLRGVVLASRGGMKLVWSEDSELVLLDTQDGWHQEIPTPSAVEEFGEIVVAQAAESLRSSIEKQLLGGKSEVTRKIARRAGMLRAIRVLVANLETSELVD